ncbi:hypothetical protein [Pacificoceanicola onchidii]|uniref:hypothetical protein n=1 Tax=Pacificoceanicola onchidii TaxID=2562685 RepID=UPI0010A4B4F1|nr:hypothetical protein [Pacificoceanicola onchidii]
MMEFVAAQPEEYRAPVMELISGGAVMVAVMLHLDFADEPIRLSNRNVPFTDLKWGHEWGAGGGLLVGLPEVTGGDGQLAPFREYQLGMPDEMIDNDQSETWAAGVVAMVGDVSNYRGRDAGLFLQLFDPETEAPEGHPFAVDIGFMDRMTVSVLRGGAIVRLTTESLLARKGVPPYGMLTYFDQKRRHATDEGLQFVTEAGKLIKWTDW